MTSSDKPRASVLADASFLTQPSNAQALEKQQLDAKAASDTKKYALIAALLFAGYWFATKRR